MMNAFILAGGFATRLWPLTEKRAKPLLPLAGVPLIEHLVRNIPEHIPITVSTNAVFREAFSIWSKSYGRSNLRILIEETTSDEQKLGALGATAQWISQEHICDDVLLVTGDNYCGFSFDAFLRAATPDVTLLAVHDIQDHKKASQYGTVIAEQSMVKAFEEKPENPKTTLVNTGCSLLPASVLPVIVEHAAKHPDNVGGVFEEMLRRSLPIECFRFDEPWFDIGTFEAYMEATKALVGERVLEEVGSETEQSICSGSVVVGKRSVVSRSELRDVVLFEDCIVEDCVLSSCILDRGCVLRNVELEGKMLREGAHLRRQ